MDEFDGLSVCYPTSDMIEDLTEVEILVAYSTFPQMNGVNFAEIRKVNQKTFEGFDGSDQLYPDHERIR